MSATPLGEAQPLAEHAGNDGRGTVRDGHLVPHPEPDHAAVPSRTRRTVTRGGLVGCACPYHLVHRHLGGIADRADRRRRGGGGPRQLPHAVVFRRRALSLVALLGTWRFVPERFNPSGEGRQRGNSGEMICRCGDHGIAADQPGPGAVHGAEGESKPVIVVDIQCRCHNRAETSFRKSRSIL